MRARVRPLAAGLLGLTLLLAGCSATTAGQASVAGSAAASLAASGASTSLPATDTSSGDTDTSSSSSSQDTDSTSSESSSSESSTSLPSVPGGPGGLPSISVPGFNTACISVAATYASVELSLLSAVTGTGTYDGAQVLGSLQSLGGAVPAELKDAFTTLTQAVQQANGKSAADADGILQSAAVTKAGDDIKNWLDKNCGG